MQWIGCLKIQRIILMQQVNDSSNPHGTSIGSKLTTSSYFNLISG
jgi:hypothetical protein